MELIDSCEAKPCIFMARPTNTFVRLGFSSTGYLKPKGKKFLTSFTTPVTVFKNLVGLLYHPLICSQKRR